MKRHILFLNVLMAGVMSAAAHAEDPSPYEQQVRRDKPVAYWRFEEAPGESRAADRAGGHAGRVQNVEFGQPSASPVLGHAARFSGAADGSCRIDIGSPAALKLNGDITIEWWQMSEPAEGTMQTVLAWTVPGEDAASNCLYEAMLRQPPPDSKGKRGPAKFAAGHESGVGANAKAESTAGVDALPGVWHHVALVRRANDQTWQIYVNGLPDGPPQKYKLNPSGGGNSALTIGAMPGFENAHFRGVLDEVAVYDKPLSAERVLAHYKAALAGRGLDLAKFEISAHRGNSMHAPENTLIAYEQAIEAGGKLLEMDVRLSKDNIAILLHDTTLDRTTDAKGKPEQFSAAELTELDAGKWFDAKYAGVKIPTLEEVARACKGRGIVFLDLKGSGLGAPVAAALKAAGVGLDEVIAGPWNDEVAADMQAHLPGIRMMLIGKPPESWDDAWFEQQKARGYNALWFNHKFTTQAFIDASHRHGLPIYLWTVNDPAVMSTVIFSGADGIVTDDPATVKKLLSTLREK